MVVTLDTDRVPNGDRVGLEIYVLVVSIFLQYTVLTSVKDVLLTKQLIICVDLM